MLDQDQFHEALAVIDALDCRQIAGQMRAAKLPFKIDFTPEWIESRSLAELRHVFAAICLQCDLMPEPPADYARAAPALRLAA